MTNKNSTTFTLRNNVKVDPDRLTRKKRCTISLYNHLVPPYTQRVLGTGLTHNFQDKPQGGAKATRTGSEQQLCKQLHFGGTNEKKVGGQKTAVTEIRISRLGDVT